MTLHTPPTETKNGAGTSTNENQEILRRQEKLESQLEQVGAQFLIAQQQQNEAADAGDDDDASNNQAAARADISAIRNIKIPPFWKVNLTQWFRQAEMAFDLIQVTSDTTKYKHIVLQLDQSVLPYVSDIISNPPTKDKDKTIKERIIGSFAETSESKLRRLLRGVQYTDEKPSAILQKIKISPTANAVIRFCARYF